MTDDETDEEMDIYDYIELNVMDALREEEGDDEF